MVKYPKYTTTVVGAHSVPDWFEALDRLVAVGQLAMGALTDAQYRTTQAAVLDQELAAIDVITGGEMHRRTHNRHSPPNAMLNFFWQKIPAFQGPTRPKPIWQVAELQFQAFGRSRLQEYTTRRAYFHHFRRG